MTLVIRVEGRSRPDAGPERWEQRDALSVDEGAERSESPMLIRPEIGSSPSLTAGTGYRLA